MQSLDNKRSTNEKQSPLDVPKTERQSRDRGCAKYYSPIFDATTSGIAYVTAFVTL